MKIVVASAFEAASPKAHAINTVKIAEGFARLGHALHLICLSPKRGLVSPDELNARYAISSPIIWHQLPAKWMGRAVTPHWFFCALAFPLILRIKPDLIYSRNYILPAMSSRFGIPTIGETHAWPDNQTREFRTFLKATRHKAFRHCVTISPYLAEQYAQLGAASDKLMVLPDAVDLRMFSAPETLHLQPSPYASCGPHVVYAGHLYDYKGIPTVLEAAALLPAVQFHLVGGLPKDIERHQQTIQAQQLQNVTLHGLKPYSEVPAYLWHADLLLLPPSANHPSAQWTSPVKLGEYLASGTPTLITRIPALTHWVTEDEACFVPPDNAPAMAESIRQLLTDKQRAQQLAAQGLKKAQQLTYEARVSKMLASWTQEVVS
jgi:glycosyltransferase involved in cell wall biosynthesis